MVEQNLHNVASIAQRGRLERGFRALCIWQIRTTNFECVRGKMYLVLCLDRSAGIQEQFRASSVRLAGIMEWSVANLIVPCKEFSEHARTITRARMQYRIDGIDVRAFLEQRCKNGRPSCLCCHKEWRASVLAQHKAVSPR